MKVTLQFGKYYNRRVILINTVLRTPVAVWITYGILSYIIMQKYSFYGEIQLIVLSVLGTAWYYWIFLDVVRYRWLKRRNLMDLDLTYYGMKYNEDD